MRSMSHVVADETFDASGNNSMIMADESEILLQGMDEQMDNSSQAQIEDGSAAGDDQIFQDDDDDDTLMSDTDLP